MDFPEDTGLDKTVLTVSSSDEPSDEKAFWLSRTPYECLRAVETYRRLNYGYHQSSGRLQRVLEIARLNTSFSEDQEKQP